MDKITGKRSNNKRVEVLHHYLGISQCNDYMKVKFTNPSFLVLLSSTDLPGFGIKITLSIQPYLVIPEI